MHVEKNAFEIFHICRLPYEMHSWNLTCPDTFVFNRPQMMIYPILECTIHSNLINLLAFSSNCFETNFSIYRLWFTWFILQPQGVLMPVCTYILYVVLFIIHTILPVLTTILAFKYFQMRFNS